MGIWAAIYSRTRCGPGIWNEALHNKIDVASFYKLIYGVVTNY